MKNKVIALRGIANQGKSRSIKEAYDLLKKSYVVDSTIHEISGADLRVVLIIGDVKIGIESQGDPNSRLTNSLILFSNLGCQIIICATRTRGSTVNAVQALKSTYEVIFLDKAGEQDKSKQNAANLTTAKLIVLHVQNILKA